MEPNEASVRIAAPRETVFRWVSEPGLLERWVGGMREFRPLDPEPGPGSRAVQVVEQAGRTFELESEITHWEPPAALTAHARHRDLDLVASYRLEPEGDGTRVTATADLTLHGLGRLLGGVARRQGQRKLEHDLDRLKRLVEAEAAHEPDANRGT